MLTKIHQNSRKIHEIRENFVGNPKVNFILKCFANLRKENSTDKTIRPTAKVKIKVWWYTLLVYLVAYIPKTQKLLNFLGQLTLP